MELWAVWFFTETYDLGLPFLSAGGWVIYCVIQIVPPFMGSFILFSDTLLLGGAGLIALSGGLLLAWFGLWVSLSLCKLWVGKVLSPLAKRMCTKEEAP